MKIKDITSTEFINDKTEIYIRNDDNFSIFAHGNWYEDNILRYNDTEVASFTWQDDNKIYIDIKLTEQEKIRIPKYLYKTRDIQNGDTWYFDTISDVKKQAEKYIDECEGDCILIYRVYDYINKKYRQMTDREVKEAGLPR